MERKEGALRQLLHSGLAWQLGRQRRGWAVSALQHRRHLLELPRLLLDQRFVDVVPPENSR